MRYNLPLKAPGEAGGPLPSARREGEPFFRKRRTGSLTPPNLFDLFAAKLGSGKANIPTTNEDRTRVEEDKKDKDTAGVEANQNNNGHPRSSSLPEIELRPNHLDLLSRCLTSGGRQFPSVLEKEEEDARLTETGSLCLENPSSGDR